MAKLYIYLLLLSITQFLVYYQINFSYGQSLVPGLMIFGDSVMDTGNNNNLVTVVKAVFPPYGRDFVSHKPTGRFCNGKLATDITAETLGFTSYPPSYLSKEARGNNLLSGANFASGGSGYLDTTARLYGAIPLTHQLRNFEEYGQKVRKIAGEETATTLITESIYLLSMGSSDYVQNYYINPAFRAIYTPDQFADLLIHSFDSFVNGLYNLGARRIGVTSLPPLGCLPASITLFGLGQNECVERLNVNAISFNTKLDAAITTLRETHEDLKLVFLDIFNPLLDLIKNPAENGFFETRKACCGTGIIETSFLCNRVSQGTCSNATGYVFWDSFHPTESANQALSDALLEQGVELIS